MWNNLAYPTAIIRCTGVPFSADGFVSDGPKMASGRAMNRTPNIATTTSGNHNSVRCLKVRFYDTKIHTSSP